MNTIVRALPHHQRFASRAQDRVIAARHWAQAIIMALALLITAFTVVYMKDYYRRLFIEYQNLQNTQNQLYIEWGKLLLEQSTWSTQARVQTIAQQRLGMQVPQAKDVVIVQN